VARRGNPNWIAATQEPEPAGALAEIERSGVAPILGAAGGALAIVIGAERLQLSQEQVAWGAAALGYLVATQTTGIVRELATGLAAAGACIGVLRLVDRKTDAPPRNADAPVEPDSSTDTAAEKTVASLQEISARLSDEEKDRLAEMAAKLPADELRAVEAQVVSLPIDEAAKFLRRVLAGSQRGASS
jgi:hypothetical protein